MADSSADPDLGTKKLSPKDLTPLVQLYLIPYLRWDREGHQTFESSRARLLNMISSLIEQMYTSPNATTNPLRFLMLGGQTVILEDVGAVRPDLVEKMIEFNDQGRLSIGPWYIAVNEALVSDESIIRNLLAARADARRHRVKLMPVAYFPESYGHVSQLPQIMHGFGVDAALIRHGLPVVHLPFHWEAPNLNHVLVVNEEPRPNWPVMEATVKEIVNSLEQQRTVHPDGPFLWIYEITDPEASMAELVKEIGEKVNVPVQFSNLLQYTIALRNELPDEMRPELGGELWIQSLQEHAYLFPGTLSSRIYLKQKNAELQGYLSHVVEPLVTVALTHGKPRHFDNLLNLLDHAWRLLLKNQAANALGGTGIDAVHRDNEMRFQAVADNVALLVNDALEALPGTRHKVGQHPKSDETFVMVWSGHNWPVKQMVEVQLDLPAGKHPASVTSPHEKSIAFAWRPDAAGGNGGTLMFIAESAGLGYVAYKIGLADTPPATEHLIMTASGSSITNEAEDTVSIQDGSLVWRQGLYVIRDLLEFHDGGDAGDTFNYSPPTSDRIVKADLINEAMVETCAVYQRLIVQHRMRVAVGLNVDRNRSRGLRLIELTTEITLYNGIPGVYFRTTFENTARDHRLRAHLHTGIQNDIVHADSAFALVKRLAVTQGEAFPVADQKNIEGVVNTQPMHQVVSIAGEERALNLMVRGLPEYEAIPEDDQTTLAVTLVRAVGWLSRYDLRSRTAAVAPQIEVPEAQCLRQFTSEYGLVYSEPNEPAKVLQAGHAFNTPLLALQYDTVPERPERSFLSVISNRGTGATNDGDGAIVTAFKPPVRGSGWIVRLHNPNDDPVEVHLTPHQQPSGCYLLMMSEKPRRNIDLDSNGTALMVIAPHDVVTVRFGFEA